MASFCRELKAEGQVLNTLFDLTGFSRPTSRTVTALNKCSYGSGLRARHQLEPEALRRDAIDKLAESDAQAGGKHLQVLTEIMRLRRACCEPKLVRPELGLPSAKLQQFGEVLAELLDNDHKALVFSQFVDHPENINYNKT